MTSNKPEVVAEVLRHFHNLIIDWKTPESDALCHAGDQLIRLSDYEALQAECEKLRRDAERYVPLHEVVQRAAGELPAGWAIQLSVERHEVWVELIGPDGTEDFDTNNERLDYTVIDALEAAIQGSNP